MAMSESTPAPPYGAVANKDNTHQGECESDDNQNKDDPGCDIDPADIEDGEILDDSGGDDSKVAVETETMVSLEKIILNNPVGAEESEIKKKKKKKAKRPGSANDENAKKRKKHPEHNRSDESEESPNSRSRTSQKRHHDGSFGSSRHPEKGSFEDDIAIEERRHKKLNSKGSVHQRLGERSSRSKGRSGGNIKTGTAGRKRGAMGRIMPRKREVRHKPICKFFLDGNCNKGDVCNFSHDVSPLKKRDLCKFYLNGYCAKEKACLFMHDDFPCKFFHTGAVCYADTECRFSHDQLTDETKMLLDRYLDMCHSSSKMDRRRDHSPKRMDRNRMPPHHPNNNNEMKMRPSLLGSPPRHIKEAASEWQQDLMMQQMNENSPPHMSRPNFYMDTMEASPQRGGMMHGNMMMQEPFQMGGHFPQVTNCGDITPQQGGATPIPTDDEEECDADERMNFPHPVHVRFFQQQPPPLLPPQPQQPPPLLQQQQQQLSPMGRLLPADAEEKISTALSNIRAESDYQRTPPQLEVERSLSPTSRPSANAQPPDLLAGSPEPHSPSAKTELKEEESEETGTDTNDDTNQVNEDIPVVFPLHLPRKQRELFMRIQQHQRLAKLKSGGDSSTDENEDSFEEKQPKPEPTDVPKEEIVKPAEVEKVEVKEPVVEPVVQESVLPEVKKEEEEEEEEYDDEDGGEENKKEKWYSSDDDDDNGDQPLTDMLKRLQQMPPPVVPAPATSGATPAIDIAKMLSSIREQATQQSTSVSPGLKSDFWQNIFSGATPPANTDLETKPLNRDPRSRSASATQPSTIDKPSGRPLTARDPRLLSRISGEIVPPAVKHKPMPVVPHREDPPKEKKSGQSSYKLHTVTVMPLNYSSYLFATQNDTKLLDDPRLKKLLSSQTSPKPMASLPFPPELQLFLEQNEAKAKAAPPSPAPTPTPPPVLPTLQSQPPPTGNLILGAIGGPVVKSDPRLKRGNPLPLQPPPLSAQSPVHSGGFTPPHLGNPLMDMPPNFLPGVFNPPPPVNPQMMDMPNPHMMGYPMRPMNPMMDMGHPGMHPNPMMMHSHMPRGFVDPRFARLQPPMNLRRGRGNMRHQAPPRKNPQKEKPPTPAPEEPKVVEAPQSEPDKKSLRKKQMDYASPLSAYDEGTPSEGSAYNRRPQQTPRTVLPVSPRSTTPPLPPPPNVQSASKDTSSDSAETPKEEDLSSASVREVFKTIDPTASPFC